LKLNQHSTGALNVLLLHGFAAYDFVWQPLVKDLSNKNYAVFTINLPGFLNTTFYPFNTLEQLAKDIIEQIHKLNLAPLYVFGHSMGGYLALELAMANPNHIKGLGLICSSFLSEQIDRIENRRKAINSLKEYGALPYLKTAIPTYYTAKNIALANLHIDKIINIEPEILIHYQQAMINRNNYISSLKDHQFNLALFSGNQDNLVNSLQIEEMMATNLINMHFSYSEAAHMVMLEANICQDICNFMHNK
jgi:3-oxoadipate enol-lactonase